MLPPACAFLQYTCAIRQDPLFHPKVVYIRGSLLVSVRNYYVVYIFNKGSWTFMVVGKILFAMFRSHSGNLLQAIQDYQSVIATLQIKNLPTTVNVQDPSLNIVAHGNMMLKEYM